MLKLLSLAGPATKAPLTPSSVTSEKLSFEDQLKALRPLWKAHKAHANDIFEAGCSICIWRATVFANRNDERKGNQAKAYLANYSQEEKDRAILDVATALQDFDTVTPRPVSMEVVA